MEPYADYLVGPNTVTLAELIGEDFTAPNKTASPTMTYTFTGRWYDWNDNKKVYCQEGYGLNGDRMFATFKPNGKDMLLVPEFAESVRKYTVKFFDWNHQLGVNDELFTLEGNYEDYLSSLNAGEQYDARLYYLYRPNDDNIAADKRYGFKGWQNESDFNNNITNPSLIDLSKVQLRSDLNYFAYYEPEDPKTVASSDVLFDFI